MGAEKSKEVPTAVWGQTLLLLRTQPGDGGKEDAGATAGGCEGVYFWHPVDPGPPIP